MWKYEIGDKLICERKENNPNAKFSVKLVWIGKKSWANEKSINFWLKRIWSLNNQKRRFLVWDAFRAHITPSVKESVRMKYNSDLCVIPGGCTSKLQSADVSWNKPFKSHLSEMYDEWLFSGPMEKTKGGNRRAPSKPLILK